MVAEDELIQRLSEIKENLVNSSESEHILMPTLSIIDKIKSEKQILENELELK